MFQISSTFFCLTYLGIRNLCVLRQKTYIELIFTYLFYILGCFSLVRACISPKLEEIGLAAPATDIL